MNWLVSTNLQIVFQLVEAFLDDGFVYGMIWKVQFMYSVIM